MSLALRFPRPEDETVLREMHQRFRADDFAFLFHEGSWEEVLAQIRHEAAGVDLPPDRVRAEFLVAEVDGQIVGRTSIRYALTPFLRAAGGHIGYAVAPEFRRRGYATEILHRSLDRLAAAGVTRALLTVEDGNVGSTAVIESCGAELEDVQVHDGTPMRRYWIDTAASR